jgi:hypothetical protein
MSSVGVSPVLYFGGLLFARRSQRVRAGLTAHSQNAELAGTRTHIKLGETTMTIVKHTTNIGLINQSILAGVLSVAAAICFATASNSAERPLSFRDVEYYITDDDAMDAANAFVASQLPPGLSRADAVERLTSSGMVCGRPESPDALTCTFVGWPADRWTVRLTFDNHAEVSKATVDHAKIGWPRDGG